MAPFAPWAMLPKLLTPEIGGGRARLSAFAGTLFFRCCCTVRQEFDMGIKLSYGDGGRRCACRNNCLAECSMGRGIRLTVCPLQSAGSACLLITTRRLRCSELRSVMRSAAAFAPSMLF